MVRVTADRAPVVGRDMEVVPGMHAGRTLPSNDPSRDPSSNGSWSDEAGAHQQALCMLVASGACKSIAPMRCSSTNSG